ncbi:MAG: response regulator transcription factor [Methylococcales bacterium]
MHTYNVLIVDDQPLFREALKNIIMAGYPGSKVSAVGNIEIVMKIVEEGSKLDLLLLDIDSPYINGMNSLRALSKVAPEIPIAIYSTAQHKELLLQCFNLGAIGFIPKSSRRDQVTEALSRILSGEYYAPSRIVRGSDTLSENSSNSSTHEQISPELLCSLTHRQLTVLERLSKGESNKEIAEYLNIAESTAKTHVSAILHRLNLHSRTQAALYTSDFQFDEYLKR